MSRVFFSAVCFDMDGVLIQSRSVIEDAWMSVARLYGITVTDDDIRDHIHGRAGQYTLDTLFASYPVEERVLIKKKVDSFEETAPCALLPGVADMIHQLKSAHIPLALVTSSWQERIRFVMQLHGLHGMFDTIISREDVGQGKPSPECYQLAASRLQRPAKECLVFEDSVSGVRAALQSGARCVGIGREESLIQAGADARYEDFQAFRFHVEDGGKNYLETCGDVAILSLVERSSAKQVFSA
ncbi:HAD family phosphatase [Chromobacterium vaccinii]|uniref:HAD family hydrolase n=1 Tax=Chromobacterium vaccinii TaxID=1108595 RepID=UPI001E315AB4|nr:HAD family phosphatase [Chromobacterium vaccinii]MCD4483002.1 HAD family phosphatase [Chromobacterium vaccinii]